VQLVKGHPLLVTAAISAVRNWRYTPPTLNGNLIEILLFVDVNFFLN
jgi:protein TonB